MTKHLLGASLLAACFCSTALFAAENAPPQRPDGLHIDPVGKGPFYYDTAEGMDIRVRVLARGLDHPWSMAWLPDGTSQFKDFSFVPDDAAASNDEAVKKAAQAAKP